MLESLFNKVAGLKTCEYCEIFKNTYDEERLWVATYNSRNEKTMTGPLEKIS